MRAKIYCPLQIGLVNLSPKFDNFPKDEGSVDPANHLHAFPDNSFIWSSYPLLLDTNIPRTYRVSISQERYNC